MQLLRQGQHLFNVSSAKAFGIILFLLIGSADLLAQSQENNWFFGFWNHVEFENGITPVVYPEDPVYATEGSASISNAAGQLQFYTTGLLVFDRFGGVMPGPNTLYGSDSSTQNTIIIPFPGDTEERWYYVFTVPAQGDFYNGYAHSGLEYMVVDMAGNNGLGVVSQASQELVPMVEEKIHATWHTNNRDVWLVVHSLDSDAFYSFLIDCQGINDPVISNTGRQREQGLDWVSAIGSLKLSPNSQRIAVAFSSQTDEGFLDEAVIEVGSFNPENGIIEITDEFSYGQELFAHSYSCEFSPNSDVLYWSLLGGEALRQFDLTADDFGSTIQVLGLDFGWFWASLTRGPDGTVYGARSNGNPFLGRIEFPDIVGIDCNPIEEAVALNGLNSLGIPNNWMYPFPEQLVPEDELVELTLCEGSELELSAADLNGDYLWNTGATTSTETVSEAGTYWLQVNDGCFEAQRTFEVTEIERPFLEITTSNDFVCDGDSVFVEVTTAAEWEWENGSSIPDTLFTTNVTTYLTLFEEQCMWQEDFLFEFQQRPTVELEEQFTFCEEETFLFEVDPAQGTTLMWSDGESDWVFESAQEGNHWVEITNSCGTERLDFETVSTFCTCEVFIPNAFTPDLNDLNENFKPVSTCPFVDYSFLIFNRWGEVMFETADPSDAWNGNVSGGEHYAPDEVYTYVLRYGLPNGDREEVYGSVIILR